MLGIIPGGWRLRPRRILEAGGGGQGGPWRQAGVEAKEGPGGRLEAGGGGQGGSWRQAGGWRWRKRRVLAGNGLRTSALLKDPSVSVFPGLGYWVYTWN